MGRIFQADMIALSTINQGTFAVCQWTAPVGGGTLWVLGVGGELNTMQTAEAFYGYCYPVFNGVEKRGMEVRICAGDTMGINIDHLIIEIPDGLSLSANDKIEIVMRVQALSGSYVIRGRGIILGVE